MANVIIRPVVFLSGLAGFCTPVLADPLTIGFAITSTFLPAAYATTAVVYGTGYAALAGAAYLVNKVTSKKGGAVQTIQPQQAKNIFRGGNGSELILLGRGQLSGLEFFGDSTNYSRFRLVAHARGPWSGIEKYFLGGREVTVEVNGVVSSPPYVKSADDSYILWKTKTGDGSETAWAETNVAFPARWTPSHRVRGVFQSQIIYSTPGVTTPKHQKLYQAGFPKPTIQGRGLPIYDPRDPGQSAIDQSTWEWSDNGVLGAAYVLQSFPNFSVANIDFDATALEADKADIQVTTLTGTEPASRISGVYSSQSARGEVMEDVLRSIGAEIVPSGDHRYKIRMLSDDPAIEFKIPSKHMQRLYMSMGPDSPDRPNIVTIKYWSPERNYEYPEIDLKDTPWSEHSEEIDLVGRQVEEIELPHCTSASQAQRIGRRLFELSRADKGVAIYNFAGMAAWGARTGNISFPDVGDEFKILWKKCRVDDLRVDDAEGEVEIHFTIWPDELRDNPWSPATMEAPAPEQAPELLYEAELDTPSAPSAVIYVQYPGGQYEVRLKIAPVAGATIAEANLRPYSDEFAQVWQSMLEHDLDMAYKVEDLTDQKLDFRVRYFNDDFDGSNFSDLLEITSLITDNTALTAPAFSVTGTPGDYDAVVTIASDYNCAFVKIQYRTYLTGFPGGTWVDVDTRDIRPGDGISVNVSNVPDEGFTIAIRAAVYTTNSTQTVSGEFTYDEPIPAP